MLNTNGERIKIKVQFYVGKLLIVMYIESDLLLGDVRLEMI